MCHVSTVRSRNSLARLAVNQHQRPLNSPAGRSGTLFTVFFTVARYNHKHLLKEKGVADQVAICNMRSTATSLTNMRNVTPGFRNGQNAAYATMSGHHRIAALDCGFKHAARQQYRSFRS